MTRPSFALLFGLSLLAAPGCAALSDFEATLTRAGIARFDSHHAGGVQITQGRRVGRGAVVGPNRVLTVLHVVEDAEPIYVSTSRRGGLVEARVVGQVPATPEPYVVLELDVEHGLGSLFGFSGFADDRWLTAGDGEPRGVLTARGYRTWSNGQLLPGDSGSPVLDEAGGLVGLVHGRRMFSAEPVCVRLRGDAALEAPGVALSRD